tara:strand:+ start:301 stop:591 length:291 start_codon:yes stop_codon:yes gene_type:complete
MIAGTPKSAGSIVDVDQHIGDMLIGIGKADAVVEACEAPIAEPVVKETVKQNDFTLMTKAQLEDFGHTIGLELDRRLNKTTLISQLEKAISTKEET